MLLFVVEGGEALANSSAGSAKEFLKGREFASERGEGEAEPDLIPVWGRGSEEFSDLRVLDIGV